MQDSLGTSASRFKSLKDLQATHEGYYTGVRAILKVRETEPERFGGHLWRHRGTHPNRTGLRVSNRSGIGECDSKHRYRNG